MRDYQKKRLAALYMPLLSHAVFAWIAGQQPGGSRTGLIVACVVSAWLGASFGFWRVDAVFAAPGAAYPPAFFAALELYGRLGAYSPAPAAQAALGGRLPPVAALALLSLACALPAAWLGAAVSPIGRPSPGKKPASGLD